MQKINSITIINGEGTIGYFVGDNGITAIENSSDEYEDHTDFIYIIKKGKAAYKKIINCPVEIEYFAEEK